MNGYGDDAKIEDSEGFSSEKFLSQIRKALTRDCRIVYSIADET